MKSCGLRRLYGLIAAPMMSAFSSATISGPPSRGRPAPSRIRPTKSVDTGNLKTSPMKVTPESLSILAVPSNTCTITKSSDVSSTCPFLIVPFDNRNDTISPKATGSVLFKKTRGPLTSVIVRYSFPVMIIPPQLSSTVAAISSSMVFTISSIVSMYPLFKRPRIRSEREGTLTTSPS